MRIIFRSLAAILAAGIAAATTTGPNSNTFDWTTHLSPGQLIEIKGVNGSIRAEGTAGTEVEVTAEKSGRRYDPADVQIAIVDNDNGLTVCAVYPDRRGALNDCKPGGGGRSNTGNNDVKVEFTVRVPSGVRFIGRTVNGSVEALHLDADVEAHTTNGKINVSTTGTALADTVNGSIHAALGSADWDGSRNFRTVNGSIQLDLPCDIDAGLAAKTVNGHIDSDLPITVHGRCRRELKLSTVNGNITVARVS